MKIALFGALALGLSCSLASAQPAPGKTEAQLLFDKCRAAYADLKSYRGTVKAASSSRINGEENSYGGTATVTFEKPNLLRIDGKLAGPMGGDFSILGTAEGAYYRWPLENKGDWKKAEGLDMAVAVMTGVSGGTPSTITSLLMPSAGGNPFRFGDEAKIVGEELIDGQLCTKITARPASETISWWIDKKTLLLRRIVETYDEKQSAKMMAQVQKSMGEYAKPNGQPMPKLEMRFLGKTEDLQVEAVNAPVDSRLFSTVGALWPWKGN